MSEETKTTDLIYSRHCEEGRLRPYSTGCGDEAIQGRACRPGLLRAFGPRNDGVRQATPQGLTTRRAFLGGAATLAGGMLLVTVNPDSTRATPATMNAAIKKVIGEAPLRKGKVVIDVPPLVENGNTVPVTISVESPM